jgi:hypothetical protein
VDVETKTVTALYGNSLFIAGVEASLQHRSELTVARIDASLPDAADCLVALNPDVVVMDLDDPDAGLLLSFLREHPGLPVLGLGLADDRAVVLSSQRVTALTTTDLAEVIATVGRTL